mgnify:CR=1 FL=1
MHKCTSVWKGDMVFDNIIDGHPVTIAERPDEGEIVAPSPKRLMLASLAGCTGLDVVSLLNKMRAPFEHLEMDVEADLSDDIPKVYTEIRLVYRFYGKQLKKNKIEKAVRMSQDVYCGVSAMMRKNCPIIWSIEYAEGMPEQ